MAEPDEFRTIARQMLADFVMEQETVPAQIDGLIVATRRLEATLVPLFGSLGPRTMWVAALRRASLRYPCLHFVAVAQNGVEARDPFAEEPGCDRAEVRESCEGLLTTFFEVLAGLVGEDIALRLAREAARGQEDKL